MARSKGNGTRERILSTAETLVLKQGFAGTALDEILKETQLTKGAFFHHFRSKADLGRALIERFAENDFALFDGFRDRARALSDEPLQTAMIFLKLFEEFLDKLPQPFAGCMFASYVYETNQFDADVRDFVSQGFRKWSGYFEDVFQAVLDAREPKVPITARELAENIMCIYEGAFILSRAYDNPRLIQHQSEIFRRHLQVLFAD